jgi:class 3 adenylate cyclase
MYSLPLICPYEIDTMAFAEEKLPRKLSAILLADVVGYSRLMGQDEGGTLKRLKNHQNKLIDPTVKAFHGRVVKLMGDGMLMEFPSVVEAVACAVVIQEKINHCNNSTLLFMMPWEISYRWNITR